MDRRRINNFRAAFPGAELSAFLVTHLPDIYYLTGFTGSNAVLLVTEASAVLATDSRYTVQAKREVSGARVAIVKGAAAAGALLSLPEKFRGRVGVDSNSLTLSVHAALAKALRRHAPAAKLIAKPSPVAVLRQIKDADELRRMRRAAALGSELFTWLRPHIAPGVREREIAAQLEFAARNAGAEKMSFDTIVAGGDRGALPHGVASATRLKSNGLVVLDFGVILDGYCSDMTRTVQLGRPTAKQHSAWSAVLEAQLAAIEAVRPGVTCGEVDDAARSVLHSAKLAKYFTHSTGHGVGIEIHEPPRVAGKETTELKPGMVITIEPGVYLPGEFGVRMEDMVAVTDRGHAVLTTAPKEWAA